ncbi:hypothetical protein [Thauera sinica]|uniref:Uncharacterized protein n=1 Tax=Thauera sinica TaxID=2665146 RepID=A0ABW1AVN2_9RHOO|nr:hypothetical protein [Thauera sp. K11]
MHADARSGVSNGGQAFADLGPSRMIKLVVVEFVDEPQRLGSQEAAQGVCLVVPGAAEPGQRLIGERLCLGRPGLVQGRARIGLPGLGLRLHVAQQL